MACMIFAHDVPLYTYKNQVYSSGGFPSEFWDRYLSSFDRVNVIARHAGDLTVFDKRLVLCSRSEVDFLLIKNKTDFKQIKIVIKAADFVVVRLPSRVGLKVAKEALKEHKAIAAEVVGCAFQGYWYHGSVLGKFYAFYCYLTTKNILKNINNVLYVTKQYLQSKYPSGCPKSNVIASNVDLNVKFISSYPKNLDNLKKKVVIGLMANYSASYKGIDTAIRALRLVNRKYSNIELQIVGNGNPSKYHKLSAELGVSEQVVFLGGFPPGQKIFNWLSTVDIYIQPSLTEGLPRSLIEAMSQGCPSIATNVGGIPELLSNDFLIDKNNYKDLAEKIINLMNDKDLYFRASSENIHASSMYTRTKLEPIRKSFYQRFKKMGS